MLDLAWEPAPGRLSVDLDASVIAFDASAKKLEIVWYQHQNEFAGALQHTGDDSAVRTARSPPSGVLVDLGRLPDDVTALVFTINSFHGHTFTDLTQRLLRAQRRGRPPIVTYDLTDTQPSTAVLMAIVRRTGPGVWQMRAIGEYHDFRTVKKLVDPAARQVGITDDRATMAKGANIAVEAPAVRAVLRGRPGRACPTSTRRRCCSRTNGRVASDDDFVFYNQPQHPSGAVRHAGKSGTADALEVTLRTVPADVDRIVLAASADGGTFGQVPGLRLSVSDLASGAALASFPMTASDETAFALRRVLPARRRLEVPRGRTGLDERARRPGHRLRHLGRRRAAASPHPPPTAARRATAAAGRRRFRAPHRRPFRHRPPPASRPARRRHRRHHPAPASPAGRHHRPAAAPVGVPTSTRGGSASSRAAGSAW